MYIQWNIMQALKKGRNHVTCYNMSEPLGHYGKWNKPVTKEQKLYYSTHKISKLDKTKESESRNEFAKVGQRGGGGISV